ncbi:MAG: hypothetical protein ACYCQI_08445 [Gammaproteobacteria bacterium]
MASSQQQFDIDFKEEEQITVPLGVVNTILGYEGSMPAKGETAGVSLVSTLFNSIKLTRKKLLKAIVSGNLDEAKKILENNPSLLYEKREEKDFVTAPTGHKFNLKPYQAALCVDDTQMADMIKANFAKLGDEEEANNQYDEQCPDQWETAEEKKWQPLYDQLTRLKNAIINHKPGDLTRSLADDPNNSTIQVKAGSLVERELHEFWRLLDATRDEVITVGKRPFNPNLFEKAVRILEDEFTRKLYKEWVELPNVLFWQDVIGYNGIERIMPVNYVQAFQDYATLSATLILKNEPQPRGIHFKIHRRESPWIGVDFYPLQDRGSLGFNFAIYSGAYGWRTPAALNSGFSKLCQAKKICLSLLRDPGRRRQICP